MRLFNFGGGKKQGGNVIKTSEERRAQSNKKIMDMGIACFEGLPCISSGDKVEIKSDVEIAKRAIASLLIANLAISIYNGEDKKESEDIIKNVAMRFGVWDELTEDEKHIFEENVTQQDLINIQWRMESVEVLLWILGMLPELSFPKEMVDGCKLNACVSKYSSFDEFMRDVKTISTELILDEADLEYRYHWACVDKQINPQINIGELYSDVVYERRRALEWVIGEVGDDWDNISLDT